MKMSEQINELAAALSAFQGQIQGAKKDSANPFFKSSYADLESVWDAIREPLAKNGLSVTQLIGQEGEHPNLTTVLMHKSGQYLQSTVDLLMTKKDAQGLGSSSTYTRRYQLCAILGVYQVDDDGNAASGKTQTANAPAQHNPIKTMDYKKFIIPFGASKGKMLGDLTTDDLKSAKVWLEKNNLDATGKEFLNAVNKVLGV